MMDLLYPEETKPKMGDAATIPIREPGGEQSERLTLDTKDSEVSYRTESWKGGEVGKLDKPPGNVWVSPPKFAGLVGQMVAGGSYETNQDAESMLEESGVRRGAGQAEDVNRPMNAGIMPGQTGNVTTMPRYLGTETKRTPRSVLDLGPGDIFRLASTLKMPPANALDLLSKVQEAQMPKYRAHYGTRGELGILEERRGKPPKETFWRGPQYPAAGTGRTGLSRVTRTVVGAGGKPRDVTYTFDALGALVGQTDLGEHYEKPEKPEKGGMPASDKAAIRSEIRRLTTENKTLGDKLVDKQSQYTETPDGLMYTNPTTGAQTPIEKDVANKINEQLSTMSDRINQRIVDNEKRLEELNKQIGGTWRAPDRSTDKGEYTTEPPQAAIDFLEQHKGDQSIRDQFKAKYGSLPEGH
jgi:hypothetical protein